MGVACDGLVIVAWGAWEAGVSRQRMQVLIEQNKIPAFEYNGIIWLSSGACRKWKRQHPKGGCNSATVQTDAEAAI